MIDGWILVFAIGSGVCMVEVLRYLGEGFVSFCGWSRVERGLKSAQMLYDTWVKIWVPERVKPELCEEITYWDSNYACSLCIFTREVVRGKAELGQEDFASWSLSQSRASSWKRKRLITLRGRCIKSWGLVETWSCCIEIRCFWSRSAQRDRSKDLYYLNIERPPPQNYYVRLESEVSREIMIRYLNCRMKS
jgi:hypothetical protein